MPGPVGCGLAVRPCLADPPDNLGDPPGMNIAHDETFPFYTTRLMPKPKRHPRDGSDIGLHQP